MSVVTNLTTTGDISQRTSTFAAVKLLERGQHLMTVERFGQVDPHRKGAGKTITWRRYNSLARATSPLAEGIPPTGQKLTKTDIPLTLEQFGDVIKITDVIADTHEDPVFDEAITVLSEQLAETIEEIRINPLKAGSNIFYAGGVSSRATVNSPPLRSDLRKIYRYFKKYKAREISKIIAPSALVSTEPVASAYFIMGHTDLDADFRGMTGFIEAEKYSQTGKILPGEIGKVEQFRIVLTPMFEPWLAAATSATGTTYLSGGVQVSSAAAPDVYPLICVGKDAYGIVPLQGYQSVTPYVINPKPTKDDPLGQYGIVGWKTWQGCVILNQNWLARYETAATASPD